MKPASLLVAVLHVLRLVFKTEVLIGGWALPMWVSGLGCVAAAALSVLVFREAIAARTP